MARSPLRAVDCPTCQAPAGKACKKAGQSCAPHQARIKLSKTATVGTRSRRLKSGNTGHRLQRTAAPSKAIRAKQAKVRRPSEITVRYADGTIVVRPASSFGPSRKKPKRKLPKSRNPARSLHAQLDRELDARVERDGHGSPASS